jgi:YggT family protein
VFYVVQFIRVLAQIFTFLVFVQVILSYFISPFHPIRQAIDQIVEPLLSPIRRRIPPVGMFDFSPFVLIILIQITVSLVTYLLLRI